MNSWNPGIEILCVTRYDYDNRSIHFPHTHNCFQLTFIFSGDGEVSIDDERFPVEPDSLLCISPESKHYFISVSSTIKTYNIKFHLSSHDLFSEMRHIPCRSVTTSTIHDTFIEIHRIGMEKKPYFEEKCQLKVMTLLYELLTISRRETAGIENNCRIYTEKCAKIQSILNYFYANYHRPITTEMISNESGYSYRHVSDMFHKEFGKSPVAYLEWLRIEKAMELIRNSDQGLKNIADMVGFHSIHYFTSVFKKQIGLPPGEWRTREQSGIGKELLLKDGFVNRLYISRTDQYV